MTVDDLSKRAKEIGKGIANCVIALIGVYFPGINVVPPIIEVVKKFTVQPPSGSLSFAEIKSIFQKAVPSSLSDYSEIICTAADICLQNVELLTNPYTSSECAAQLTEDFIRQYQKQYSEAETEAIYTQLPFVLEAAISELHIQLASNPSFLVCWKIITNNRLFHIESIQKEQGKQIAQQADIIAKIEQSSPRIPEYHSFYRYKWDDPLFLDPDKKLKQVYQLPHYQYSDYMLDEELEDYPDSNTTYSDLNVQLQDTVSLSNTEKRMLVILGHPGSGKSTLITYFLNNRSYSTNRRVLVYRFSSFEGINWNGKPENIPQLMLNEMGLSISNLSNCILILDGLDEAAMHSGHEELLNNIYQQWAKSKDITNFSLIVTCRRNRIDSIDNLQMRHILLCPFDKSQIELFACNYWGKSKNDFNKSEANIINRINDDSRHLSSVMGIPLILYMTLALGINLSEETGLCDIYEKIFSINDEDNSIYYRQKYDKVHSVTSKDAEKIHSFSKKIAQLIWEFNPSKGIVDKEKYEPIANQIAGVDRDGGLRDLLIGQYFMEGKNGHQLLFVHRSMHEYFIALSFYDSIKHLVESKHSPQELYQEITFGGERCTLTEFTNLLGMQNLAAFPDIQEHLMQMFKEKPLGDSAWCQEFFSHFLEFGLANAACGRSKSGVVGLGEELTRFHNLLWLTREQLRCFGQSTPFTLCSGFKDSIYFKIPYDGKIDLQELCLNDINLPCHKFNAAQLSEVHMPRAVLPYSDFSDASLDYANFSFAKMEQCNFSRSLLPSTNFSNSNLEGSHFDDALLKYTNFRGANLTGVHFDHADISCADFSGAILDNASFSGAVIENTIFDRASLQHANLSNQDIKSSSFKSSVLIGASFENSRVSSDTSMENADMQSCNLLSSDFTNVNFVCANLESAQIIDAHLQGCNLDEANLSRADISSSNLQSANLDSTIMKNTIAENTDLSNARLLYTDLRGASLTHAVLSGAKLSRVKADKHAFDSSVFDSEDWSHWDIYYPDTVGKHGNHQSVTHDSILNDLIEVDDDTHVSLSELELYKEICIEHECPYSDYQ